MRTINEFLRGHLWPVFARSFYEIREREELDTEDHRGDTEDHRDGNNGVLFR